MANQEDFERIVSVESRFYDFKMTIDDLPHTRGRIEQYLYENNIPPKKIRMILITILFAIPVVTIAMFYRNHPTFDTLEQHSQRNTVLYEQELFGN